MREEEKILEYIRGFIKTLLRELLLMPGEVDVDEVMYLMGAHLKAHAQGELMSRGYSNRELARILNDFADRLERGTKNTERSGVIPFRSMEQVGLNRQGSGEFMDLRR